MNRKQFALLLFLLVVLGIGGLMVYNRQNDLSGVGDPALGKKLLGNFPVNDVAHIAFQQGTNELNLVKKDNLWRVRERDDYPANYQQISEALLKLSDLKVVQSETVGASQLPRLDLVAGQGSNAALVVDFKDAQDKSLRTLLLGKKHMQKSNRPSPYGDMSEGYPDGRYVKVGATSDKVDLVGDGLTQLEPRPEQWLNKDFFKVEKLRSISLSGPAATNSWQVSRETETGEWKLADAKTGEQLDTSKASAFNNALTSPTFTDVAPASKADQLGLAKPNVLTVQTFDNFTYTVKVGQKTNDDYPVLISVTADLPKERTPGKDEKPDDKAKLDKVFKDNQSVLEAKLDKDKTYGNWVYLMSSWTLDPLLKDRAQLLVEKKEAKEPTASATTPPGPEASTDVTKIVNPITLGTNAPAQ